MSTNIKKYILQQAKFIDSLNYTDGKRYVDSLNWLADTGKTFKNVNIELSKKYSKYSSLKECYRNCWVVTTEFPRLDYYQGYAKSSTTGIFEHTFLVKNNKVIDPTMGISGANLRKSYKKIFNKGHEPKEKENSFPKEYFGIKISNLELKTMMLESKEFRNYIPDLYELRNDM